MRRDKRKLSATLARSVGSHHSLQFSKAKGQEWGAAQPGPASRKGLDSAEGFCLGPCLPSVARQPDAIDASGSLLQNRSVDVSSWA